MGGSSHNEERNIKNNGEITKINTLFPSKRSNQTGDVKGGIQLIKLKKNNNYDNTGIRKAILLCKYVEIIKKWIEVDGNKDYYSSSTLKINEQYKQIFINFMDYFKKEMNECKDDTLKKEVDIMNKLIKL